MKVAGRQPESELRSHSNSLRILAVSALWLGANDHAFVNAFRRAGHSVHVVSEDSFFPKWTSRPMRAMRRLALGAFEYEYNNALRRAALAFNPDLFFVFKGTHVWRRTIEEIKAGGTLAVQYYPDTGFVDHGKNLIDAIGCYDWIFTTKSAHLDELPGRFGIRNISFLPHAYDRDTHLRIKLLNKDIGQYGCDVSFIGNVSSKKLKQMKFLRDRLSGVDLRIWGPSRWSDFDTNGSNVYQGHCVTGLEFAKAICASKINLGLLYEGNSDASSSDKTTSRSFEIPACGGFMLHERTSEIMEYFEDGRECGMFSDESELLHKITYYLENGKERKSVAAAGRRRCLASGHSADDRVKAVIAKYHEIHSCIQPGDAR